MRPPSSSRMALETSVWVISRPSPRAVPSRTRNRAIFSPSVMADCNILLLAIFVKGGKIPDGYIGSSWKLPRQLAQAPRQLAEALRQLVKAPRQLAQAPRQLVEAPRQLAEAPVSSWKLPVNSRKLPVSSGKLAGNPN